MKNITVTVPDDVYRNARIRAAERGTSVSALVAEYLRSLSLREAAFSRLEAQQQQVQREIRRFRARDRLEPGECCLAQGHPRRQGRRALGPGAAGVLRAGHPGKPPRPP